MPEELAVAAVTVLALLLVGGGRRAGAVLRTAVLVGALVPVVLLWVIHAVLAAVALTVGVTAEPHTGRLRAATRRWEARGGGTVGRRAGMEGESLHRPSRRVMASNGPIQR